MKFDPKQEVRTWIEISQRSLFSNLRYFEQRAGDTRVMVMIKSNAYGHGLYTVAKLLTGFRIQESGFRKNRKGKLASESLFLNSQLWFGADSITEASGLRRRGIKNPILVLGYTLPARLKEAEKKRISVTISNFEAMQAIAKLKKRPKFHLKIDTGMHRQGFQESDLSRMVAYLKRYGLKPEGTYSHLAMPENKIFSRKQLAVFRLALLELEAAGVDPGIRHFNKTEGIVLWPEANFDMVRLGIGAYGYYPRPAGRGSPGAAGRPLPIHLVLSWKTIVSEVKSVKKGEAISYDLTEKFSRDSRIAIIPIGYWHGLDRRLSSKGEVLIRGRRARILGRVTMDMTMVDITKIPNVRVGDEVVLIGRQGRDIISADEIGEKIGTTSYEILTRLNPLILKVVK